MKHFPIFLDLEGRIVLVAGGGDEALAKLRLILKTDARVRVFAPGAQAAIPVEIRDWAAAGRLTLVPRALAADDLAGALLLYAATGDDAEDARIAALGAAAGVLVNRVDNLDGSAFITPAIVDRDPVTVAIGTEGTAPVLARRIKADVEAMLPQDLGLRARVAAGLRGLAEALPHGTRRRAFWSDFFGGTDAAPAGRDDAALLAHGRALLARHLAGHDGPGHVAFVGAGPGDPDLLTMAARRALDTADVVIHDRLVPAAILELARREARIIEAGKTAYGPSTEQAAIHALMTGHAAAGARVVRLKSGDPTIFGRLDEEIAALDAAGIGWRILPGITAASAAAAALGQSLTARGRNSALRIIAGHDVAGYAEHDWQALARPGAVTAIYMGRKAARFVQGRLMMHGAAGTTEVSIVENAGRPEQRILGTTLAALDGAVAGFAGPAVIVIGLSPRAATIALDAAPAARTEIAF